MHTFRLRTVIALLGVGLCLCLSGCGNVRDGLERATGTRRVTVATQVNTAKGMLTVYRFTEDHWCGEGVTYKGMNGEGVQPCDSMGTFTQGGSSNGDFSVLYGQVNDPAVAKVVVVTADGQELTAALENGIWYVLFPGQPKLPDLLRLEGFNSSGGRLHPAPAQ